MYSLTVHLNGNYGTLLPNGILPVEILHRKWHFTSGIFPWEMAFYQWKLSMGNGTLSVKIFHENAILPVEIFHRKLHFTSGNFP